MENTKEVEGKVGKQALLIDNLYPKISDLINQSSNPISDLRKASKMHFKGGLLAVAGSIFLLGGLIFAASVGLAAAIDTDVSLMAVELLKLAPIMGLALSLLVTGSVVVRDPHLLPIKLNPKDIEFNSLIATLTKKGYVVSVLHEFHVDWKSSLNQLVKKANPDTTTFLYWCGHGRIENGASKINDAELNDEVFVSDISKIPGNKIVAIDACMAGGFADAASKLSDEEKEKLVIATSSNTKHVKTINPFQRILQKMAKKNPVSFVTEFNKANSRLPVSVKSEAVYEPRIGGAQKVAIRL